MKILTLNAGSSSLKCRCDTLTSTPRSEAPAPEWQTSADWTSDDPVESVLQSAPGGVDVVGHRVVHGGTIHDSALLTDDVLREIASATELAPEHNRRALEAISTARQFFGERVRHVGVFDTAFHATMAAAAYTYPIPYSLTEEGIRRFGFHGISHRYAARRAAEILGGNADALRIVTCHLGNGASLAAVRGGKCVDTTMGFTPIEGLMMGERSGSIDPGILLHLVRTHGYSADQLEQLLNRQSGLLGVSGVSNDMREILAAIDKGDRRARLAFEIYTHRLIREIGGMIAVLGGGDALAFTGGVGEHCAPLRERVAENFKFLEPRILVIPAQEEWEIVRECWTVTSGR